MNLYLNLYKNNGSTAISTGDNTAPLTFILDATNNEVGTDTLVARCEAGYQTSGTTTISITSDTGNHWALSLDGTTWNDTIVFTDTITTSDETFFVKANATSDETPHNDTSTKIHVVTKIAAV